MPGYDSWKTRSPDDDLPGEEEPSYEQQKADYEDEMQQKDDDLRWVRQELFALCEYTEGAEVGTDTADETQDAFDRGRIYEAKRIRRTMGEVIAARLRS